MFVKEKIENQQVVNKDLSTWGKQFSDSLKSGQKAENDMFQGMGNNFDEEEWNSVKWKGGKVE